ncbi:Pyrroline-5-carboxylate reductase [Hibiscus syriacus]|uniref:Pyrroline-5-carboxylate reductase n=1 Tax=Hibiscus syriacus TaxID=106335 RepID=A0A6A2YQA2_HIBSY|nr:pyrroline-5-carboxylate reductase-like [Hibiscus syriacus]KAE8681486.1 Pyrroline-5-carboxylate reductase [Hibiscus syriacus]
MEAVPIHTESFKLGFVGAGKLAESIARGVVQSGLLPPQRISTAIHSNPDRGLGFQSLGIHVYSYNNDVVNASDVIIFSVKPQVVKNVVLQLRPLLSKKKLLVSIAAGIKQKDLQEWAGQGRFIRVIPNTPSAVGMAASVMSLGESATEQDGKLVEKLFGSVGKIWKADEKLFDAVTGTDDCWTIILYKHAN